MLTPTSSNGHTTNNINSHRRSRSSIIAQGVQNNPNLTLETLLNDLFIQNGELPSLEAQLLGKLQKKRRYLFAIREKLGSLQQALKENCNKQKERRWLSILTRYVDTSYCTDSNALKAQEKELKTTLARVRLESEKTTEEVKILKNRLAKFQKVQTAEAVRLESSKAEQAIDQLEARESRAQRRKEILSALTSFSKNIDQDLANCIREAADYAKQSVEQGTDIYSGTDIKIEALPSLLQIKQAQAKDLASFYANAAEYFEEPLNMVKSQFHMLKTYRPWYRCQTQINKIERREIDFVIKQIKEGKALLTQAHKKAKRENQRLNSQQRKLTRVLAKLVELNQKDEVEKCKPRFQQKLTELNQLRDNLKNDREQKPRLCFCSSVKEENDLVLERVELNFSTKISSELTSLLTPLFDPLNIDNS